MYSVYWNFWVVCEKLDANASVSHQTLLRDVTLDRRKIDDRKDIDHCGAC